MTKQEALKELREANQQLKAAKGGDDFYAYSAAKEAVRLANRNVQRAAR